MNTAPTFEPAIVRLDGLPLEAVAGARVVLCDLDGCLVSEGRAYPESARFVAGCGERLWIVSNRSDTTAVGLAEQLAGIGLAVPAGRILLAGEVVLDHLVKVLGLRRLRVFAAEPLVARAVALGADPGAERPEAVLLCRDPGVTVETLGPILADLDGGAALWVSNEDLSHPGLDGRVVAETGALLAALRAIRPGLVWQSFGKPHTAMLRLALARTGSRAEEAVFVGDNATTDGRAAASAGIRFVHVQREGVR